MEDAVVAEIDPMQELADMCPLRHEVAEQQWIEDLYILRCCGFLDQLNDE